MNGWRRVLAQVSQLAGRAAAWLRQRIRLPQRAPGSASSSATDQPIEFIEATAVLTGIAFFAGWEWARAYYEEFRISLGQIDVSIPNYFVWSYRPLTQYWLSSVVVIFAVVSCMQGRRRLAGVHPYFLNLVFTFILLLVFVGVSHFSRRTGLSDALRDKRAPSESFPLVSIHLKDPAKADRDAAREGFGLIHGGQYFLFGLHKGLYYLIPIYPADGAAVIMVPVDSISSVIFRR